MKFETLDASRRFSMSYAVVSGKQSAIFVYRLTFDSNDRTPDGAYLLWSEPAVAELAAIAGGPRVGMRVVLYTEDLECEAILEFEPKWGWVGQPDEKTYRDPLGGE